MAKKAAATDTTQSAIAEGIRHERIEVAAQEMIKAKTAVQKATKNYESAYQSVGSAMEDEELEEYELFDTTGKVTYKRRAAEVKLTFKLPK